ncbi:TonB-dependent receptor [bacterium]|nr:TonB-dependent receptor [bacterium]
MRIRRWALLPCVMLVAMPALAAETLELTPVTVRAARPRFPEQPQAVTLIDRAKIEASGASNLAQLLRHEGGLSIREYGPVGQLSTATMRGSLGEGVLVLRDGIKLNSPTLGGADLSTIPLIGVERVEILSGGASGLFGSEAVGGVINLISGQAPSSRLEAGAGSWGQRFVRAETGGVVGDTTLRAAINRQGADNAYPYYDAIRREEKSRLNAGLDALGVSIGARHNWLDDVLSADLSLSDQQKGVPGPINVPSAKAAQRDQDALAAIRWERFWQDGPRQLTSLSHRHNLLDYSDPLAGGGMDSETIVDTTDLQTQLEWTGEFNVASWGLGVTQDALGSSNLGARARTSLVTFVHDTWSISDRFTLHGNLRLDHNSTFGLNTSPRVGGTFALSSDARLRFAAGQAYRAPTFNDLYWPSGGNPTLRPEITRLFEVGADLARGKALSGAVTAFLNQGTDTIMWLPGANGMWSPSNIGRTETLGLELKAALSPLDALKFEGSGTWLSARDLATAGAGAGKFLMYRPDLFGRLEATWRPFEPLALSAGWDYTGKRYTTAANTEFLEPVGLWSARASYAATRHDTLSVRGENLSNAYYELQPNYPMPGASVMASWAHSF